jgi:hypothetical protein
MRKSIRYYITTAGEEPTVRSVQVALTASELAERAETDAPLAKESVPQRRRLAPGGVRRLVKGAIVKRASRG